MRRRRPGGMLLQQDLPEATANATPASGADEMLQAPVAAPDVPEPTPPAVPPAVLDPFPELSLSAMEPPPEPVAPPHIPSQVLPSQAPAVPAPFAAAAPEVLAPAGPLPSRTGPSGRRAVRRTGACCSGGADHCGGASQGSRASHGCAISQPCRTPQSAYPISGWRRRTGVAGVWRLVVVGRRTSRATPDGGKTGGDARRSVPA